MIEKQLRSTISDSFNLPHLNEIVKEKKNVITQVKFLADIYKFPVNSIDDLPALSYVLEREEQEPLAQLVMEYHIKMKTRIESETDLDINVKQQGRA